jgi:dTDP-glucose pyrophosphorylase
MRNYKDHLILSGSSVKEALVRLNELSQDAILFVVNDQNKLIGSLTDGDIRRGLLKDYTVTSSVDNIIQKIPLFIRKGENNLQKIIKSRENNYKILPVIDHEDKVVNVINFRLRRSYLPIDAVIMAGGRGQRLSPLTDSIPKPLLVVGDKPIIDHNISRLAQYGIDDYWISVKYLGEQIEAYFGTGGGRGINIHYVWEDQPLGTIGAVSQINDFQHDYVLVSNSDILTNLDYEHFFLDFIDRDADISIVTIPYQVNIPYAVLETNDGAVVDFKEKPTYTYYSNGGIYLIKKSALHLIPRNKNYNATDLIEELINNGQKVISYPLVGYWLDIGNPDDFEKAHRDIKNIKF